MYKLSKRFMAGCVIAAVLISTGAPGFSVNAEGEDQEYDSSNVGIASKVESYINEGNSEDPVSDLTGGIVTYADVYATYNVDTTEDTYLASMSDASGTDAVEASPTDAKVFTQFQDRAVATSEGKVNIRTEASTDSEVVGVLDRGGVCLVDEIGEEWTKIESGTCVGYIANEYLAYGDDSGYWC